jgi:hypothetical protein
MADILCWNISPFWHCSFVLFFEFTNLLIQEPDHRLLFPSDDIFYSHRKTRTTTTSSATALSNAKKIKPTHSPVQSPSMHTHSTTHYSATTDRHHHADNNINDKCLQDKVCRGCARGADGISVNIDKLRAILTVALRDRQICIANNPLYSPQAAVVAAKGVIKKHDVNTLKDEVIEGVQGNRGSVGVNKKQKQPKIREKQRVVKFFN